MEITLTTKHGQLSDSIQQKIKEKAQRLPRFFDRTTGIDVLIDLEHEDKPKVEIRVSAEETNDFFATDSGSNVVVATDSVLQKLEQQLRKHKEKLTGHRGKSVKHIDLSQDE